MVKDIYSIECETCHSYNISPVKCESCWKKEIKQKIIKEIENLPPYTFAFNGIPKEITADSFKQNVLKILKGEKKTMTTELFNLSEKIHINNTNNNWTFIRIEDVKEFIRLLKEYDWDVEACCHGINKKDFIMVLDKLAGKSLC